MQLWVIALLGTVYIHDQVVEGAHRHVAAAPLSGWLIAGVLLPYVALAGVVHLVCWASVKEMDRRGSMRAVMTAERMLAALHADHLFLGADGLDLEVGLTTPDILEAQLNNVMIQVSSQVTVVADSSKIGRRSLSSIGEISAIHRLITDQSIDPAIAEAIRAKGIELVIV